jgi:pyrimidine operon attenuation protein/uracil phosphoribosyltransferase
MTEPRRQLLMGERDVERALARMARELVERNRGVANLALVGVQRRGVQLAERIAAEIERAEGQRPPVGTLDITLYRDDLTTIAPNPVIQGTEIPCSIDGRTVVLLDDVLYTGRTVRAALDELIDFGRPARIRLAVLVDRGHRELPIRADFVGKQLTTRHDEVVQVRLRETDGEDRVLLLEKQGSAPTGRSKAGARR